MTASENSGTCFAVKAEAAAPVRQMHTKQDAYYFLALNPDTSRLKYGNW